MIDNALIKKVNLCSQRTSFQFVILTILLAIAGCFSSIPADDLSLAPRGLTFDQTGKYIIGPMDELVITVHGQQTMNGTYRVETSGAISFPIIGFVQAKGLTIRKFADQLEQKLSPYVQKPRVSVSGVTINSYKVYFSGEVNKPGAYNYTEKSTILQGIAIAGGLSRFATGRIVILRINEQGQISRYAADYEDVIRGKNNLDSMLLERGDIVHAE